MNALKTSIVAAGLALAASSFAQDKPPAPEKPAGEPVMEITRTGKLPCEIKPVMTDEEIIRCGGRPQSKPLPPIPAKS